MAKRKPGPKPKKKLGRPRHKRWIEDYAALGPPPSDPLEALEWGFRALMVSLSKTIQDPHMNEHERSNQIRQHLRSARDLLPKSRLAELERAMAEFDRRQEAGAKTIDAEATVDSAAPAEPGSTIGGDYRRMRAGRS